MDRYRAWDKFDKEMLEVHGINFDAEGVWTKEIFDDEDTGDFIHFSDIELMQSSGHKDKNDVEIFEGDIVEHDPVPNPFFGNTNFEIVQARTGEWRIDSIRGGSVLAFHNHQVEIIGNKFEHPHLLEE